MTTSDLIWLIIDRDAISAALLPTEGMVSMQSLTGNRRRTPSLLRHGIIAVLITLTSVGATGCSSTNREAYAASDASSAVIDDFDNVRMDADVPLSNVADPAAWMAQSEQKDINFLSISGGGSGGAFAVGVLSAWSARGDRPQFDVVTGVSTGAFIAPFAFLGPDYDRSIANLYLTGKAQALIDVNWRSAGVLGASILKGNALRQMVAAEISPHLLDLIAEEHRKGRRLLIMTTNLDSQKAVVWNMGVIAASGKPDALQLFRDVLIASASIPGVFPAVTIKSRVGPRTVQELHSDGGSSSQLFTLPEDAMASPMAAKGDKKLHLHVIVNNALIPEFAMTANRTLSVAGRAYSILIKSQAKQGLLALYNYSQRTDVKFRFAAINKVVPYSILDPFNTAYMRAVYKIGYDQTISGEIWNERPVF